MRKRSELGLDGLPAPPGDDRETVVAATFAQLLGLDEVGVEDDFFMLGGDSFVALQISLALEERLAVELDASLVIECGTVRRLCAALPRRP